MLISKKHNFIFIHIYKNAGTSISTALKPFAQSRVFRTANYVLKKVKLPSPFFDPQPFHGHVTASEIREKLGHELFDSCFSFAFVRNPWDWQVSLYKFMLKKEEHHQHELIKKLGSFEEYIKWRCDQEALLQKKIIYSDEGEKLVNFVGRFETIEADFEKVCLEINVSASLPKLNVSNKNNEPYQSFYTDTTRELVEQAFKPDIELFGYEF